MTLSTPPSSPTPSTRPDIDEKLNRFIFWTTILVVYGMLGAIEYLYLRHNEITISGMTWNWGVAVFLASVLYALASFQALDVNSTGSILFFGRPLFEVKRGLVFMPFFFCQLRIDTMLTQQMELPGEPNKIFREDDVKVVPAGLVPPIRIPFGPPTPEQTDPTKVKPGFQVVAPDDRLHKRVTAELVLIIRFRIKGGHYIQFLTNIGSIEEAKRQIQDTAVAMAFREFAQVTPAFALANIGAYNGMLEKEVLKLVAGWGLELEGAQNKLINFNHSLNDAVAEVPEASLRKDVAITTAEGEGRAERIKLEERTAGYKKMKEDLGVSGDVVVGADTARAITNNPGQKTIIAGSRGFGDLAAVALGLGEALKETKTP